jgi:peptidoglycan/xylan/chitin deacetylase (PgdA/CDA1 family)
MNVLAGSAIATAAFGGVVASGIFDPRSPLFGRVIGRGPRRERVLYLTFDDGPNPSATETILESLNQARVSAAFFQVGDHARRYPALARAVAAAGHEIGNHTQHHRKLYYRSPGYIEEELRRAHDSLVEATGIAPRTFRAPHGLRNPFVHASAGRLGYDVVAWTFGVWDHEQPPADEIRRRVRVKLRPGAIVLLHDGDGYDAAADRSRTAAAVPGIIADAREAGYSFRPLSELLSAR